MVVAYLSQGRWIVDCPVSGCANAEVAAAVFTCSNCGFSGNVVWPRHLKGINRAMAKRPVPETRNWAPRGHWWEALGIPTGQTIKDLERETVENGGVT
jgi:hypothetical protein